MKYQFEKKVAVDVGLDEAIMLSNIEFWVEKNAANRKHFHKERYWSYNTVKAFSEIFPFWSGKQIRRILANLITHELLQSDNFNTKNYDQTLWYTSIRPAFLAYLQTEILKSDASSDEEYISGEGEESNDTSGNMAQQSNRPHGHMELPKRAHGVAHVGKPIPDVKPVGKPTVNRSLKKRSILHDLPLLDLPQEKMGTHLRRDTL